MRLLHQPGHCPFYESLRSKLHSPSPLERIDKEIERRTNVVGFGHFFGLMAVMPSLHNREAVVRLVGAFATGLDPLATSWRTAGTGR